MVAKLVVAKRRSPAKGGGLCPNARSSELDHYGFGHRRRVVVRSNAKKDGAGVQPLPHHWINPASTRAGHRDSARGGKFSRQAGS